MTTINGNGGDPILVRSASLDDIDFTAFYTPVITDVSGGFSGEVVIEDVVYDQLVDATYDTTGQVGTNQTIPNSFTDPLDYDVTVTNPSVGTIDSTLKVNYVSDGIANVVVSTPLLTRTVRVPCTRTTGAVQNTFNRYAVGSLGKANSDAINNAIAGETPGVALPMYSSMDTINGIYVRNPNCWATGVVDLTPVAVWASVCDYSNPSIRPPATLISPRHVIMADHYHVGYRKTPPPPYFQPGDTIDFVTADNVTVTRALTEINSSAAGYDICIGLLDSDVPASIGFAKFLPDNWWVSRVPGWSIGKLPAIQMHRTQQASIATFGCPGINPSMGQLYGLVPEDATQLPYYHEVVGGDSGSVFSLIVNGELALITHWTGTSGEPNNEGWGNNYSKVLPAISAAVTSLGGGYDITMADLSAFNTY